MVLVLSTETKLSWAACDVQQLSPCLSAITSNTKPSQLCCHSLIQQKPCFCQYLKNPTLKNYVNSPAAKKAAKTCKVSIPKALRNMAWTGNTSSVRPQAMRPETTAPAPTPAIPAATPTFNTNTVFDPNDSASPFFLHPNENPSLILVSVAMDGRNYHPWARAMEMALLSKNKLGFVDGTIAMPDVNDVKFPYWKRCNNMVSTWITRSLSSEIAQTVLWAGTAERIWETLKSRFSEADIFRVSDLHAEIHRIRQGDLTIGAYFAKLKVLWDELQVIRPLPTCNCPRRCDCDALEGKIPHQVLFGKPPQFSHLKTFGCLAYAANLSGYKSKFAPRARRCLFLGYPNGVKGYKLYDLQTREVFISRDVIFHERVFPYGLQHVSDSQPPKPSLILPTATHLTDEPVSKPFPRPNITLPDTSTAYLQSNNPSTHNESTSTSPSDHSEPSVSENQVETHQQQVRRSSRLTSRPAYLQDYDCQFPNIRTSPHTLSAVLSYDKLSPKIVNDFLDFIAFNRPFGEDSIPVIRKYHTARSSSCCLSSFQDPVLLISIGTLWGLVTAHLLIVLH
nr:uncharacterized protein LOC109168309 [Ipomoea batatas]